MRRFSQLERTALVLLLGLVARPASAQGEPGTAPGPATPADDQPEGERPEQRQESERGDLPEGEPETPAPAPAPGEAGELDEAALDDMDAELIAEAEAAATKPIPTGKGAIIGVVTDTEFNEPLIEAPVTVLGTRIKTVTDLEGRYRLELPPGTYTIRVSYEIHKPARFENIVVVEGKYVRADVGLAPDEAAVDVVDIVEEANKSTLEGMLLARQRAAVVGDGIGRTEIAKSPDRNAAQAAQRVVGATVVGSRFVYVRGLGERYTNALLNGVPLPSPEPDRAAVPLDLFSSGLLNSLTIVKTFTPDVPADFAGGSVRIETREIPSEPIFQLSLRGGYNTQSTFRERLSHRGGDLDWLGIDDGTRSLPEGFPGYALFPGNTKPDGTTVGDADLDAAGLQLNSYMSATRAFTPPDYSVALIAGDGWDLGNGRKLGAIGGITYGRSFTIREGEIVRIFQGDASDPRGFSPARDYRADSGVDSVNWGGFGSVTYRFDRQHKLSLLGLRSTLGDKRTTYLHGYHDVRDQDIHATRLSFVSRILNVGMLTGDHTFEEAGGSRLEWNLVVSNAAREEPDRRDTVWGRGRQSTTGNYVFTDATESGRHFFSDQIENQYGGGVDYTQPVGPRNTSLKLGSLVSLRERAFDSRTMRFRSLPAGGTLLQCQPGQFDSCNDALFVPDNIGTALRLQENTKPGDSYDAFLNIYAGYVMADIGLHDDLRVVLGERIEHTHQVIDPYDRFGGPDTLERAEIRQTDLLPALAAIWSPTKKSKVRGSVTRTLARPQLRELAPATFVDYFGGRIVGGNPNLEVTHITNVDARYEYFPTLREVMALSLFYKNFQDPIEPVILASGDEGAETFRNAEGAELVGVELELRRGLEVLSESLKDFSLVTNLTVAHSSIDIREEGTLDLTNLSRPLVNQAPWVFNFVLDYTNDEVGTSARVLYNVVGPRIAQVGSAGLDDVYEHSRNIVDLTLQQRVIENLLLKLEVKNLFNAPVLLTQGCGNDGPFGGTWNLGCSAGESEAVSRYTEGTSIALTGSYDFQ